MLTKTPLNIWAIALNLGLGPIYLALKQTGFSNIGCVLISSVLIGGPFSLVFLRYRSIIKMNAKILVSLFGTSLMWWPVFVDEPTKFLDEPTTAIFIAVSISMLLGLSLLVASVFLPSGDVD